jgi:putative ABC transport system permease protein
LTHEASPEIYLSLWEATAFSKHLVIRTTGDPRAVLLAVARELAIRSAVGAEQKDIRNLIFGEGFRLIASGVLAGVALAIVLSRVLRTFLFEVQTSDPATLLVVGALFVGVALLACWAPVRRATKVDPLEALRYE